MQVNTPIQTVTMATASHCSVTNLTHHIVSPALTLRAQPIEHPRDLPYICMLFICYGHPVQFLSRIYFFN